MFTKNEQWRLHSPSAAKVTWLSQTFRPLQGIRARILPVVVELLGTPLPADLQHTPSCRLRELVASSNDLVSAALDLGAVPKLLDVLLAHGGNPTPQALVRGGLHASD